MILRLQSEEQLQELEKRIQAQCKAKHHETSCPPYIKQPVKNGGLKDSGNGSRTHQDQRRRSIKRSARGNRQKLLDVPERDIQKAVLALLERHPKVAWVKRMNSGAGKKNGTYIRFGFQGCPDLVGQMKDGRILGVEVKRKGQGPNLAQQNHIAMMLRNNGVAGIVRSVEEALLLIG